MDLMLSVNNEFLQSDVVCYGKAIPYQELNDQIGRLNNFQQAEDWLLSTVRQMLDGIRSESQLSVNAYVMQAMQYVNRNYGSDISLDSAAEGIGISPFYLSRLFKQELKQNFVEYLTEIRMKRAIWLVEHTRMSIKEISRQVGYDNPTYFCKVFKKNTGKTLREIREQQWKNQF
jgi:two-component system response regulator YesN